MRLRESGMPEETCWETLFGVRLIRNRFEANRRLAEVTEFGGKCGTFTISWAQRISGALTTFDLDPLATTILAQGWLASDVADPLMRWGSGQARATQPYPPRYKSTRHWPPVAAAGVAAARTFPRWGAASDAGRSLTVVPLV